MDIPPLISCLTKKQSQAIMYMKGCDIMFELYEISLVQAEQHPLMTSPQLKELFLGFSSWAAVNRLPDEALMDSREDYLLAFYPGNGDAISRVLALDDEVAKEAAIRFLCLPSAFWIERRAITLPQPVDSQKAAAMKAALQSPALISRLIGISLSDSPLHLHISASAPKDIRMHFLSDTGVFLSVGEDINLNAYAAWKEGDLLQIFKALADQSRLEMVRALIKEPLSATQLAEKVNLTLSTINHHITRLVEARLVNLALSSKPGKGALFEANKPVIAEVIQMISREVL
jgi:DNA-binding transcriptional ArsR family regulator